jgi:hypothetical protein
MIAAALAALALAAPCDLHGAQPFTFPDAACSPGVIAHVPSKAEACTPSLHPRDDVSKALRRRVIARYGLDPATFKGEADHVEPVWLLGRSVLGNLAPEPGPIPNPKDRLEFRLFRRVCFSDPLPMRPVTAVRIFRNVNWLPAFEYYVLGVGPRPAS